MLHVVLYCNSKQIKIKNFAANRRFTAVTAENGGFRYLPFFGDGQKKWFFRYKK